MQFRHELKHRINQGDKRILMSRLDVVADRDIHSVDGTYRIRSLYFDNLYDRALMEKLNGINNREKFRLRCYNGDSSFIRLEKKLKRDGMTCKEAELITGEETARLIRGELSWMRDDERPLVRELYMKLINEGLLPKTIVEYKRIAYTYAPGNVRVTIDYDIHTGMYCTRFLDYDSVLLPIPGEVYIMEVKWDTFLPDIIKGVIGLGDRRTAAFSKYAACRMYE